MIKRKLLKIDDAGHGWLSVSNKDIKLLGIENNISKFSYMNYTRTYLEEDCDAGVFIDTAKNRGWNITIENNGQKEDTSFIRSLGLYDSSFIKYPLCINRNIAVYSGKEYLPAKIISETSKKFFIQMMNGVPKKYHIPKSNPFRYIQEMV